MDGLGFPSEAFFSPCAKPFLTYIYRLDLIWRCCVRTITSAHPIPTVLLLDSMSAFLVLAAK